MKISDGEAKTAAFLKAIGSPTRVAILYRLNGIRPVKEIAEAMETTHSAVSHQLAVLKKHGIVTSRRDSREQIYSLADNKRGKAVWSALDLV